MTSSVIHPLSLGVASVALVVSSQTVFAASFILQDIQVRGLQRVNAGTVLGVRPKSVLSRGSQWIIRLLVCHRAGA